MSQGLDHTIQHFNEMFINNLSQSFSQVFIKEKSTSSQSTKLDDPIQEKENEEDMEEFTPIAVIDEPDTFEDVQEIEKVLVDDAETKEKSKEMAESIKEQEQAVVKIECSLSEREKMLEVVKDLKAKMENNLL